MFCVNCLIIVNIQYLLQNYLYVIQQIIDKRFIKNSQKLKKLTKYTSVSNLEILKCGGSCPPNPERCGGSVNLTGDFTYPVLILEILNVGQLPP